MAANYQTPLLHCVCLPAITPIYVPVVTVYILLKLYIAIKYSRTSIIRTPVPLQC